MEEYIGDSEITISEKTEKIVIPKVELNKDITSIINEIISYNPNYKNQILNYKFDDILKGKSFKDKGVKFVLEKYNIHTLGELMDCEKISIKNIDEIKEKKLLMFKIDLIKAIKSININENDYMLNPEQLDISLYIKYLIEKYEDLEEIYENIDIVSFLPNSTKMEKKIIKTLKSNKVTNILDLLDYDIKNLKNIKGVGDKRLDDIIDIIREEINSAYLKYEKLEKGIFHISGYKYGLLKDYKISELYEFLYEKDLACKELVLHEKVEYLQNKKYSEIENLQVKYLLYKINLDLNKLIDINKLLRRSLPEKLTERDKKIVCQRVHGVRTLEEIGDYYDLTRERVRQIESDVLKETFENLKKNDFLKSMKLNFKNKDFFCINKLEKYLDDDNLDLINLITSDRIEGLYYYPLLERVYFKSTDGMELYLESVIEELPDYGKIDEHLDSVLESLATIFENITYESSIKLLKANGLKRKGPYYFKGKATNNIMLEIIFRYALKSKLRLDEKGAAKINKYYKEIFDIETDRNWESWKSIIYRVKDIILVQPNTFMHIECIDVETKIIKDLKKIIEDHLNEGINVYADNLFDEINSKHPDNNIISKYHLYSLVRYYYSEHFQTSSGKSLKIIKKGVPNISNAEHLYNICKINGGIMSFEKIKEITNWDKHRIQLTVVNSEKLIKLGNNKYALLETVFKGKEKEVFREILKQDMKYGYTTTNRLFHKISNTEEMKEFISRNKIKNGKELSNIIKYLDENIEGHNMFMYYEDQEIKNIKDVISKRYPNKFCRDRIAEILEDLKLDPEYIHYVIDELSDHNEYIRISRGMYQNYKKIKIDKKIVNKVLLYFDQVYEEKGLIVPNDHIGKIESLVGKIDYEWNQYIISAILRYNGYKKLSRFNSDYRYEIIVLVKEDKKYNDISYLIYELIKNEYSGKLQEIPVYEFLANKGIYRKQEEDYNKKLQMDARENNLLTLNVLRHIKLKAE